MEIGIAIVVVLVVILLGVLLVETKEYNEHKKVVMHYNETGAQFIAAFETVKGAINHNADIQKDVLEKVMALEKAMEVVFTLLNLHDQALGQKTVANLKRMLDEPFLPLKKLED